MKISRLASGHEPGLDFRCERRLAAFRPGGARWRRAHISSSAGGLSIEACEGGAPHGFIGQEAEVASGIARFIHGGKY
jgi:hypothetical protein